MKPARRIRAPKDGASHLEEIRALSLAERGERIASACRAAARILEGRLASGLPEPSPAPWPESTREFLRKHAPHATRG